MDSASLIEPLSSHPQLAALASLVRASAIDATLARRADYAARETVGGSATGPGHVPEGLTSEDADTPFGNVLHVLEHGATSAEERALLGALLALSLRLNPPPDSEAAHEIAWHLVWLSTHTPCDALSALDAALGEDAAALWEGVGRLFVEPDSAPPDFGLAEALIAAAALRRSHSEEALRVRAWSVNKPLDPAIQVILGPGGDDPASELWGEIQSPPRSALLTVVLAVTLLLFLLKVLRLLARYAFAYRRPAALRLSPQGIELTQRVELMGRVLRDRVTIVPLANLARVTREVRFARAGLYVGLCALTLGTYFGTGLLVDGVRVPGGSGPLLGLAALFVIAGLAVDFVLSSGADALRGRCRVVVVPRRGRSLCLGGLDPQRADALLASLATRTGEPEPKPAAESAAAAPAEAT